MKILLATGIYPPESGGPATYTAGLSSVLREQGHEVHVLAYGDPSLKEEYVTRISRRGGAFVRYIRYAWSAFWHAYHADSVYVQGPVSEGLPTMIGAWFAVRSYTMKVVGDYAWEMAMQRGETDLLDVFLTKRHRGVIGWYERIERWTARRADRVIVPSRYLATVVERWGVPRERIHVVLNANEPLPPSRGREAERSALGVSDRVVVMTAVRAVPWKGVAELIESVVGLPPSHILVVAGDGPELSRWKALAEGHGVSDRVRFLGRIDRTALAGWYVAADVFVLNSGYEGYPHVVAEAASCGVPCLVSDQGGNPETKEIFPDLVRVLPYRDIAAWTHALSAVTKRDERMPVAPSWTYSEMVDRTIETLRGTRDPLSVVMVSYDRELLDPASVAFHRVASLASTGIVIHALVISKADGSASTQDRTFSARAVGSVGIFRIVSAISTGIKLARSGSHRVLVTAQDPFAAGLTGYVISRYSNAPLELQEHGDFYSGAWATESLRNRLFAPIGRFLLRHAEQVRAVSDRVKAHLISIGVDVSRIFVIPVAQNVTALLSRPFGAVSPVPHIVVPCRFVAQKGLDVLLEALSRVANQRVPFHLTLIGSGPLQADLMRQVAKLGLTDRVTIEPWRESSRLWDEADLFILSSRYEGWGRTIVEAMAAGVPVVTTDVGCVGSFFRPQVDGRVVQPDDVAGLTSAILEQLRESDRRDAMRRSAREATHRLPSITELHARQQDAWRML
ncbi:MAG: glycosyltransferase family 4 protein [Patescibacteria group bacterium]